MSLVGKKFRVTNNDQVDFVQIVEERGMDKVNALVTMKGDSDPLSEVKTVTVANLGDEVK